MEGSRHALPGITAVPHSQIWERCKRKYGPWKRERADIAPRNSDPRGTTQISKSAAQEIVNAAGVLTTIGKSSLKIPFIESNAATARKSGARKTLII